MTNQILSQEQEIKIINLTPHEINLHLEGGEVLTFPPSGVVARAAQTTERIGTINIGNADIPIIRNTYGTLEGVPEPQPGTFFIVSALAAQAAPGREDLLIPGDPVRDEKGRIVGCRSFCRI